MAGLMTGKEAPDRPPPNRWPWPPMIFLGVVLAAVLAEATIPLGFENPVWLQALGAAMVAGSVALILWAAACMHRAKTTVMPHRASDDLVTDGPFAYSRNPIYLANAGILIGAGLGFGQPWLIAAAALDAVLVTHLAIRREEAHLQARFGEAWTAYAVRVGRWVGRS